MCTGNTVLMLVPLSVIIRFGSHVLATELAWGSGLSSWLAGRMSAIRALVRWRVMDRW